MAVARTVVLVFSICLLGAAPAYADSAAALRAKSASLQEQLQHNQFNRPLVLESSEASNQLKGNIYAVIDYPFSTVRAELNNPDHWCDVMLLHLNTKYCHAVSTPRGTALNINIGKKTPEALTDSSRIKLNYTVAAAASDYLNIVLDARNGPMGTSDYRIMFEATPLSANKSFIHLTYAYSIGLAGRIAMQTYLATVGHGKVGFTAIGRNENGNPEYIGGMRGVIERNTMRYYLAIDAYLSALNAPPDEQFERRLEKWFAETERYPRQLHEIERRDYIDMKRAENARQKVAR
jgi:hypothetical protein